MSQCKETKENYLKDTKHIFKFLLDVSQNGIKCNGKTYHINFSFPADQSCHWKVLGMGGACKVATHFCHLCGCPSQNCARFRSRRRRCKRCISKNKNKCYHHEFNNNDKIAQNKEKISTLKQKYPYLSSISNEENSPFLEFKSDPNDINKETNPMHIDFVGVTCQEKLDFSLNLNRQLQLRSLAITGLKQERLERLRTALEDEHTYLELCSTVKRYEDSKQYRILPVDWCVPCIMHLHNRIVEKTFLMIIKRVTINKPIRSKKKHLLVI